MTGNSPESAVYGFTLTFLSASPFTGDRSALSSSGDRSGVAGAVSTPCIPSCYARVRNCTRWVLMTRTPRNYSYGFPRRRAPPNQNDARHRKRRVHREPRGRSLRGAWAALAVRPCSRAFGLQSRWPSNTTVLRAGRGHEFESSFQTAAHSRPSLNRAFFCPIGILMFSSPSAAPPARGDGTGGGLPNPGG